MMLASLCTEDFMPPISGSDLICTFWIRRD